LAATRGAPNGPACAIGDDDVGLVDNELSTGAAGTSTGAEAMTGRLLSAKRAAILGLLFRSLFEVGYAFRSSAANSSCVGNIAKGPSMQAHGAV